MYMHAEIEKFHEQWNIKSSKCLLTKYLLIMKGKKYKFTVEKLGRHHPNQVIEVHITSNGTNQNYLPCDRMYSASLLLFLQ